MKNNKIKVLHLGQMIGGLGVYIRNAIMYSNDNNIEYLIVCGIKDNSNKLIKNDHEIKEYKIRLFRQLNCFNDIVCLYQLIKVIIKERPNIIHCHSAKGGILGRLAGCITSTKTLYTPHAFSFLSSSSKIKRSLFLNIEKFTRLSSFLLACSNSERQLGIETVGYTDAKSFVWNNAVPDALDKLINQEGLNEGEPYICCIGRPSYQKNTFFLIEIAQRVISRYPDVKFLLLGIGYYSPHLNELRYLIEKYNLNDNFILKSWCTQEETFTFIQKSVFYLTVSRYEGLPLSVLEAMSLGKAIIASDVLGNVDCVEDKVNGFLTPLDADLFAQKILELLLDPSKCERFGRMSRVKFLENFHISTRISDLESIYKLLG